MASKKELLAKVLSSTGTLSILRHLPDIRGPQLRILTYHRVFDVADDTLFPYDPALISASTADFRRQMEYVARYFNPVTFADILAAIEGEKKLPPRAVAVTFDDGHADNYTNAFPVLREVGVPAAMFLSTGYIGGKDVFWFDRVANVLFRARSGPVEMPGLSSLSLTDVASRRLATEIVLEHLKNLSDPERREQIAQLVDTLEQPDHRELPGLSGTMTWDQIREMAAAGIEFGSHAVSHPMLTRLDDASLARELSESRAAIREHTGQAAEVITYPEGGAGAFDTRVIHAVQQAGYRLGLSYIPGANYLDRLSRYTMPRLQVERTTSHPSFQAMLELPALFAIEMSEPDSDTHRSAAAGLEAQTPAQASGHADNNANSGWQVVLPVVANNRIVQVDLSGAADTTQGEDGVQAHYLKAAGHNAHELLATMRSEWQANKGKAGIDAFILHDLHGHLLHAGHREILLQILQSANQMLNPGGVCYLGFRNGGALFGGANETTMLKPGAIRALLSAAGFESGLHKFYPYLLAGTRVLEIIPERGYTSVKNSRNWRERVKEFCYGKFGAKYWAPAYGVVAYKPAMRPSIVDELANRLQSLPQAGGQPLFMMRCQLLWRKVIFSFGHTGEKYGRLVVIYTNDPQAIARREAEARILDEMSGRVPALSPKLPRVIAQGELDGFRYFVLSEFPGMTIDRAYAGTERATQHAARFLAELHRTTAVSAADPTAAFTAQVDDLFDHARVRYPSLAEEINRLHAAVLARQNRQTDLAVPAVWQHGDYKLENVILDPASLAVVGVIDWELSKKNGLPLLDILYLFAYNRSTNDGMRITDVYRRAILPWQFSPPEREMLARYQQEMGWTLVDPVLWAAIYLVHDVGVRFSYDLDVPDLRLRLTQLLDETAAALISRPAAGANEHQK